MSTLGITLRGLWHPRSLEGNSIGAATLFPVPPGCQLDSLMDTLGHQWSLEDEPQEFSWATFFSLVGTKKGKYVASLFLKPFGNGKLTSVSRLYVKKTQ